MSAPAISAPCASGSRMASRSVGQAMGGDKSCATCRSSRIDIASIARPAPRVPAAPTSSARHLPGVVDKIDELRAKGVDEVACTAVNDAFVLQAWAVSAGAEGKVTMLADGSGEFVKAIGLDADFSKFGMGHRGQRFSMLVNDGVVEQLNVEEPGAFNVSSADYLLERL